MYSQALIDQKATTPVVRSRTIVVLVFLLWFGIASQGLAQAPIDVVQVPRDVVEAPIDVVQVPKDVVEAPIDVVEVPEDTVPAPSKAQFFEVDNDHSSLLFAVSHAGLSYTYGRFEKCSGQILLKDDLEDTYFRFEVDVASINTNSRLRDDHLLGPEFFDVKKFSKIRFKSTSVKFDEATDNYIVAGLMSMHGVERRVKMPITMIGVGKGPMGKTRGGFITKFTIQRSDFGIDSLPKVIGDQIAITFSFEGVLNDPPSEALSRSTKNK